MSKILVTGGVGFIGSHVVDLFVEQGNKAVDDLAARGTSSPNSSAKRNISRFPRG